jgi:hypothetical protein
MSAPTLISTRQPMMQKPLNEQWSDPVDSQDFRALPPSKEDPFRDEMGIWERYLFEVDHNLIASELRVLTGPWEVADRANRYGVGLLVFRGISEHAWVAGWGFPDPPSWWTVLESGFTSYEDGPRVILPPIPGQTPNSHPTIESSIRARSRYRFYLVPNAALVVEFESASFVIGSQELTVREPDMRPTLGNPTVWHTACHWP